MEGHCTIVIGANNNKEIEFTKTFDYKNQKEEAQKAFSYVMENYPIYFLGKTSNLIRMIEDIRED